MSSRIRPDEVIYRCPECRSERVIVSLYCWVNANNTDDVDVDWESDVGNSTKWYCEDCENDNFLPDEENLPQMG